VIPAIGRSLEIVNRAYANRRAARSSSTASSAAGGRSATIRASPSSVACSPSGSGPALPQGVPPVGRLYGIRRSPCTAPQWRRSSATSATSVPTPP